MHPSDTHATASGIPKHRACCTGSTYRTFSEHQYSRALTIHHVFCSKEPVPRTRQATHIDLCYVWAVGKIPTTWSFPHYWPLSASLIQEILPYRSSGVIKNWKALQNNSIMGFQCRQIIARLASPLSGSHLIGLSPYPVNTCPQTPQPQPPFRLPLPSPAEQTQAALTQPRLGEVRRQRTGWLPDLREPPPPQARARPHRSRSCSTVANPSGTLPLR